MPRGCEDGVQDDLTLGLLLDTYPQVLAPPLNDNLQYHVFFLYHAIDRDWVFNVIEKLESNTLGFRCCCQERDLSASLSQPQGVLYGIKNSLKTVLIMSADFISSTWLNCEGVIAEVDMITLHRDFVLVVLQEVELPNVVSDLSYIKAYRHGWWTKFLARLALPDDTPMTEETVLSCMSMSSSLVGLTPGLQSGHLLSSLRSRCGCCGKESVDSTQVPDELLAHGIQIHPEEYCSALGQLMSEAKFRCHVWCYNMPLMLVFFAIFLGVCLFFIPILEAHFFFSGTQVGMEYLHGAVVWLCVLTLYVFCNHLARRKMKICMYRRLAKVNTVFIKYNILVGVENLGVADCNKYYLHFFYYELGPCLAYLQELLGNLEECQPSFTNQLAGDTDTVTMEMDCDENIDNMDEGQYDQVAVLQVNQMSNDAMQNQAEDLLLDNSGEYIYRLITKKLDRPHKQRHVKGAYCLCQYVENRVYKLVV